MTIRYGVLVAITLTVFFAVVTVVFGSWYTVDQGYRGVRLRNGAIVGVADPGLGFKTPLIDSVVDISVRSNKREYDPMAAYSKDQQPAQMRVSVNYRLVAAQIREIYEQYGSEDNVVVRLIDPRVFEELKTVFGQYNAVTAIQERGKLNAEVTMAIQEAVQGPVVIESVQIENIDFSDAYEQSIEARMQAQVEVERLRQNAEREKVQKEIVITQAEAQAQSLRESANAKADATLAQAEADAAAVRLRGDADGHAMRARNAARLEALKAPGYTALIQAERWDGKLPTTIPPNGTVPFLSVTSAAGP